MARRSTSGYILDGAMRPLDFRSAILYPRMRFAVQFRPAAGAATNLQEE